jgi:hypothetical protein
LAAGLRRSSRVADETARIMEYQRTPRANSEAFAPVLATQ